MGYIPNIDMYYNNWRPIWASCVANELKKKTSKKIGRWAPFPKSSMYKQIYLLLRNKLALKNFQTTFCFVYTNFHRSPPKIHILQKNAAWWFQNQPIWKKYDRQNEWKSSPIFRGGTSKKMWKNPTDIGTDRNWGIPHFNGTYWPSTTFHLGMLAAWDQWGRVESLEITGTLNRTARCSPLKI